MGMTIDEIIQGIQIIKAQAEWDYPIDWQIVLDGAIEIMSKYQQLQAGYEKRLKADMAAMLTDIQLEIHELENPYPHDYDNLLPLAQHNAFYDAKSTIEDLVDEKIKSL